MLLRLLSWFWASWDPIPVSLYEELPLADVISCRAKRSIECHGCMLLLKFVGSAGVFSQVELLSAIRPVGDDSLVFLVLPIQTWVSIEGRDRARNCLRHHPERSSQGLFARRLYQSRGVVNASRVAYSFISLNNLSNFS
jgi:hypothetical protein